MDMTLTDQAIELQHIKEARDNAKHTYDDLQAKFQAAKFALLDRMEDEKCDGIKAAGTNFVPTQITFAQVQDRSAFVEWAEDHAPELIEARERKGLLNQRVRELLDNGEPFPPGLGFYNDRNISQRSA